MAWPSLGVREGRNHSLMTLWIGLSVLYSSFFLNNIVQNVTKMSVQGGINADWLIHRAETWGTCLGLLDL